MPCPQIQMQMMALASCQWEEPSHMSRPLYLRFHSAANLPATHASPLGCPSPLPGHLDWPGAAVRAPPAPPPPPPAPRLLTLPPLPPVPWMALLWLSTLPLLHPLLRPLLRLVLRWRQP